jgi:hypothetical protein
MAGFVRVEVLVNWTIPMGEKFTRKGWHTRAKNRCDEMFTQALIIRGLGT